MRASAARLKFGFVPISFLILTILSFAPLPAQAAFPDKPIKIIVPFAPGGGVDIMARLVADFMSRDLGEPVIVENKPGAGTIIATAAAASSTPDGYTLLMASTPYAIRASKPNCRMTLSKPSRRWP